MKTRLSIVILVLLIPALIFAGCANDREEAFAPAPSSSGGGRPSPSPSPTAAPTPMPTEDLTGKTVSRLTGKYIDIAAAERRPVAVVINNFRKALPQSGLSEADIIYEVLAEGDITRLVAIFQDYKSEKIGPVRSARHYFLDFASDHDAIFVHHGGSPKGYADIARLDVDHIDGMTYEGVTFWRDPARTRRSGMYEHSSYTGAALIAAQAEKLNFRLAPADGSLDMFLFYEEFNVPANAQKAHTVRVPFARDQDATFLYDAENQVYQRFQFGQTQIDEETGEQLTVSNILIQLTEMYVIRNDAEGRREVNLIANGEGYLITGEKYIPVTWRKESYAAPTEWFDANGEKLTLNKGKTWVCVTDASKEVILE